MRRRNFLRAGVAVGLTATLAGCSDNSGDGTETGTPTGTATDTTTETDSSEDETTTEEETEEDAPEVDRPANYRWDMSSWINTELRNELEQYVQGTTNRVLSGHPAFEYSTEQPEDDHPVDFVGLRMIRDSNFDIMAQNPNTGPMEQVAESFVDESLYQGAKNNGFIRNDSEAPSSFTTEEWLNAETVENSLDLGHNLIVSIAYQGGTLFPEISEHGVVLREVYKRHHEFDVLAWGVPMQEGSLKSGMLYSPDDDKVRTFNSGGEWSGNGEAQIHTEIQNWRVIEDPNNEARGKPTNFQHPVLFHTDEWNRQGISFEDAKGSALGMVFRIGTERFNAYTEYDATGIIDDITATTAATEQLTRTILEYNTLDEDDRADFERIRDLANFAVGKYIQDPNTRGVIDTVENGGEEYDEYFGGDFAFYEVDDEDGSNNDIIDEVRADQAGEYDNFGQVYDELEAA